MHFTKKILIVLVYLSGLSLLLLQANAQDAPAYHPSVPKPTLSDISYGEHERHVLDFWKAESGSPTPLVFVIHGGGWSGGEKERANRFADVSRLLDAGISVVAINYRLMGHIAGSGIMPPVKAPMHDAARALQFVRSKAKEWNIDKQRIGAAGGSAGACTGLWLAFHDDLADQGSKDPIARESTRLYCAAVIGAQTSLDPRQMKEWTPNSSYGGHAFGKAKFEEFLAERETILHWINEYSPYALASSDDPPVYLQYSSPPAIGQIEKDPTHSANFGLKLKERCKEVGIDCEFQYPGAPNVKHETPTDYLIATLKGISGTSEMNDSRKKPNVLFIAIDDLRPELGCYGADHIHSPNIDRLASQGVLFNKAYCQAPHCAPSRSSLLSGVHTLNFNGIPMKPEELAPGKQTLPATFRQAGYYTIGNGKIYHQREDDAAQSWSEPPFSLVNGPPENNHLTFHEKESGNFILKKNQRGPFYESPEVSDNTYIDGQTCDKAINDLQRLAKMYKPFFLACGFVRPHLPFYAPKKYWDLYDRERIEVADNPYRPKNAPDALTGSGEFGSYHDRNIEYNSPEFHKIARHGYFACVSYADALVGRLLATLDELGLRENTIVVLWGDHGWNLGEHSYWSKHNLLSTSKHAPLIISAPGFMQNVKTDGIVELVDLYPTLCELAGIRLPQHLEGTSMVPVLRNPQHPGKKAAFTKWMNGASVTTPEFSYTEWDNKQRMLFDLKKDPEENINVAENPGYKEKVEELSNLLRSW
jgi:iduronate 2-sulfatase